MLPDPVDAAAENALTRELSCAPFVARMLCARGIRSPAEAQGFLFPKLKQLNDPFLLPDMRPAIERILLALDRGERIVLYGDYDVDGVTSLAIFTRVLRAYGAAPQPFLPVRMDEGYGLSPEGIQRCVKTHAPRLLIALDCGTCSCAEIAALRASGVDVIVFDHHECKGDPPECIAVVNPKLAGGVGLDLEAGTDTRGAGSEFHYLCSAGIVFKACHALLKLRPLAGLDLRDYLDLVALGTVADIVPLVAENRILVHRGLQQFGKTRWPGVRALMAVSGVKPPLQARDIGFKLGPRINAAGRLASAEGALELLLTDDVSRASEIAVELNTRNRERQNVQAEILAQASEKLRVEFDPARDAAIVVGETGWHPGVLGIVAGHLCKEHHRPAIVVGFDETGCGKGSGRSIEGLSLVETLGCCASLLDRFGGHEMAAGLTVSRAKFDEFRRVFLRCARERLSDAQLQPRLRLDAELEIADLDYALLRQHDLLHPFGMGNRQPQFLARGVMPGNLRVVKEKHLKLTLWQGCGGRGVPAIYFGGAEIELPPTPWDVAFAIERNEYQGSISLQLQIRALRSAE